MRVTASEGYYSPEGKQAIFPLLGKNLCALDGLSEDKLKPLADSEVSCQV